MGMSHAYKKVTQHLLQLVLDWLFGRLTQSLIAVETESGGHMQKNKHGKSIGK
jgi:hypothetical protein